MQEPSKKGNVTLIGMPGCGKSTIGVLVARNLGRDFLDTDVMLQAQTGKSIAELVRELGFEGFLAREEELLLSLDVSNTVIATGGSAVYSRTAMARLAKTGPVIYIDVPLQMLMLRVPDLEARGVAIRPGCSFVDLYQERLPLYEAACTGTFAPSVLDLEDSAAGITRLVKRLEEPYVPPQGPKF